MATLEKIRNRAGLLVGFIGVALAAFLLGDFLQQGSTLFRDSQMNAISIDGKAIKINEYNDRVEQTMEMYRMQTGNSNLSDAEMTQLRNQVYNSIVAEHVLYAETEKLGLKVTPAEVYDLVQGDFISPVVLQSPFFVNPETGVFDKTALATFLKNISTKQIESYPVEQRANALQMRNVWLMMENNVRDLRLSEKFTTLIAKAVTTNKLEMIDQAIATGSTADFALVAQRATTMPDSIVTIDQAAIKKFYEGHKEAFKTEESRLVDVVYAPIVPSQEDIAQARQDIETARTELEEGQNPTDVVSEFSDEESIDAYMPLNFFQSAGFIGDLATQLQTAEVGYISPIATEDNTFSVAKLVGTKVAPDSLFVRHIMLSANEADASKVDSLLAIVKATPDTFGAVAAEHSMDNYSSKNGGEIGWLTELAADRYLGNDFRDVLFTATVGTPFKHKSQYGEHIILVEKATAPVKKYNVAYVTKKATASSKTHAQIYNELSAFLAKNKTAAAIDTASVTAGFQVMREVPVYGSQPAVAQNIEQSRELVRWSLENKKDAVSEIKECGDKFVVAVVKKVIPRGYLSVDDAREQIEPIVRNLAKVDKLYEDLKAANYSSLEAYAQAIDAQVDSVNFVKFDSNRLLGIGFEPALNAVAVYAPLNTLVPVKGNAGVYLVSVINRVDDPEKIAEIEIRNSMTLARQNIVRSRALQSLVLKTDVEDTRTRFY